jgi:hypothetical protein
MWGRNTGQASSPTNIQPECSAGVKQKPRPMGTEAKLAVTDAYTAYSGRMLGESQMS